MYFTSTIIQMEHSTSAPNERVLRITQLAKLSFNHPSVVLTVDVFLYEGYIVSAHRMVMENRPVDPGSIQGSHRPISFIRIIHRTRANDILCKTEY